MFHAVGVREAKAKFSALLSQVRAGEVITITDRGRPVAQLVPLPTADRSVEERLREMESRGAVTGSPPVAGPLPPLVTLPGDGLAQELLQEDRSAR